MIERINRYFRHAEEGVCDEVAAVVPGPNGASPRDGALVAALVTLGIPWQAALATVSIKAAVAWLPRSAQSSTSSTRAHARPSGRTRNRQDRSR